LWQLESEDDSGTRRAVRAGRQVVLH
jgi:hypothetical protein